MATNTNQVSTATRKDLLKGMALWEADHAPSEGDMLVGGNKVTDTQSFIKIAHFTRPVGPSPVDEREVLPEGRYDKVRTAEYSAQAYGLLVSFSKEAIRDNQYASVLIQTWGTDLRDLCHDVRDQALVNEFFNLAGTNTGPDGVAYISAAHPLDAEAAELTEDNTALASNSLTGTVGVELLNDAVDTLKRQYDNKGRIMRALPPLHIECDSKREVLWNQIKSPNMGYEPFNTDRNNGGMYSAMIASIIGLTRSTHDDYTIFRTANNRKMHRFVWDRQDVEVSELTYEKKDRSYEGSVDFRVAKGQFDWRGIAGALEGD